MRTAGVGSARTTLRHNPLPKQPPLLPPTQQEMVVVVVVEAVARTATTSSRTRAWRPLQLPRELGLPRRRAQPGSAPSGHADLTAGRTTATWARQGRSRATRTVTATTTKRTGAAFQAAEQPHAGAPPHRRQPRDHCPPARRWTRKGLSQGLCSQPQTRLACRRSRQLLLHRPQGPTQTRGGQHPTRIRLWLALERAPLQQLRAAFGAAPLPQPRAMPSTRPVLPVPGGTRTRGVARTRRRGAAGAQRATGSPLRWQAGEWARCSFPTGASAAPCSSAARQRRRPLRQSAPLPCRRLSGPLLSRHGSAAHETAAAERARSVSPGHRPRLLAAPWAMESKAPSRKAIASPAAVSAQLAVPAAWASPPAHLALLEPVKVPAPPATFGCPTIWRPLRVGGVAAAPSAARPAAACPQGGNKPQPGTPTRGGAAVLAVPQPSYRGGLLASRRLERRQGLACPARRACSRRGGRSLAAAMRRLQLPPPRLRPEQPRPPPLPAGSLPAAPSARETPPREALLVTPKRSRRLIWPIAGGSREACQALGRSAVLRPATRSSQARSRGPLTGHRALRPRGAVLPAPPTPGSGPLGPASMGESTGTTWTRNTTVSASIGGTTGKAMSPLGAKVRDSSEAGTTAWGCAGSRRGGRSCSGPRCLHVEGGG